VFLALATLGFAYAVYNLLYPTSIMFTTSNNGLPNLPRPSFANTDKSYYYLLLIATLLTALVMLSIRFGRLGRLLRGLADSPLALNTMGTSVNATRLIVFSISAFFAGLAGALYGSAFQAIGLQTPIFQPLTGIQLFVIVALIPGGMPWYALEGGLGLEVLPYYIQKWWPSLNVTAWVSLVLGVSAVGVALQADRPAVVVPATLKNLCERFRRVRTFAGTASARPRPAGDALEVADLNVRFGGVAAVVNLSLKAPFGQITGLIGPNGAGKTTTFNACSGLVRPPRALVKYADREINGLSPSMRARRGIGRTFQQAELWDNLTVRENVALGWEAPVAGRSPAAQLVATRDQRRQMELAAQEAMDTAGVADLSSRRVRDLSTGQRRLVELARVLAGPFDLLLLDEPSSGLDKGETERFGLVLQKVVRDRGTGILLVEHDMHLVMAVCQYIYVMDFGQKIFEGRPADVASSDIVRAAYLGSEGGEVQPLTGGTSGDGPAVEGPVGEGQEARR
jgi:ABC-type branched-subunit amino acid transport system ATPase component